MTLVIAMVFYVLDRLTLIRVCVNPTLSNIRLENENVLFFFIAVLFFCICSFLFLRTLTSLSNGTGQIIRRNVVVLSPTTKSPLSSRYYSVYISPVIKIVIR